MAQEAVVDEDVRAGRIRGPKGQAILAATRHLIGRVGVEGATFDAITAEAGVARGAVFWAFGSKERLMLTLLEDDARVRLDSLEGAVSAARSADELVDALAGQVRGFVEEDLGVHVLLQELGSIALREPSVRAALAERRREWSATFAGLLEAKQAEGAIDLATDPATAAALVTAVGHGLAINALLDPREDPAPIIEGGRSWVRGLLARPRASER